MSKQVESPFVVSMSRELKNGLGSDLPNNDHVPGGKDPTQIFPEEVSPMAKHLNIFQILLHFGNNILTKFAGLENNSDDGA